MFSLREYRLNKNQSKWLQHFQWYFIEQKDGQNHLCRLRKSIFHVFPKCDQEIQYNKEKMSHLQFEASCYQKCHMLHLEAEGPLVLL